MQIANHTVDRALSAHLARTDRFADLAEMSFTDLLSLEDDLSVSSQWSLLDDVRTELAERRSDAKSALAKLFIAQCTVGGELPMVEGGKVVPWLSTRYLTECVGSRGWIAATVDVVIGLAGRDSLIRTMADEYAREQHEELLAAGWSAQ